MNSQKNPSFLQKKSFFFSLLFFLLLLDQLSKRWIYHRGEGLFIPLITDFLSSSLSLVYVTNTGAAWGMFADYPYWLFLFRISLIAGMLFYIWKKREILLRIGFAFILSGAVGNLIDMYLYGHVIDFLAFTFGSYSFPVFNLADSSVTFGGILLFFQIKAKKL